MAAGPAPAGADPRAAFSVQDAIARVTGGHDLARHEMRTVMDRLMDGEATPAQVASLLTALRMKGESVDELVGAAEAMRGRMLRVTTTGAVVDTCGTGGDGAASFNVSTAAALVAAAAGASVAKHGNRAASGKVGGADVLEALGVRIDLAPDAVARCLADAGIGFCFAPRFHAAMRFAAAPRREIGIRTMLNLLGPLANPAGAAAQLVGVFAPEWTEPLAYALARLGTRRALVVHAGEGLDEISAAGGTRVSEVQDGAVRTYELEPKDFGVAPSPGGPPRIGDAAAGARVIRAVLAGEPGPARAYVVVNAAAVLVVAGVAANWQDGAARADAAIASGTAARVLDRLVAASNREDAPPP
jgi:anthranilate phosphoribosyltransferase